MAFRPAFAICTAWPPVRAPSAATCSSLCSSFQRRSAPSRASVCSTWTGPRSRSTSSVVYGRSIPRQRSGELPLCECITSVGVVVALAVVRARARSELGGAEDLFLRLWLYPLLARPLAEFRPLPRQNGSKIKHGAYFTTVFGAPEPVFGSQAGYACWILEPPTIA